MSYALVLSKRAPRFVPAKRDVDLSSFATKFDDLKLSLSSVLSEGQNLVASIYEAKQSVGPDDPLSDELEDLLQAVASFNFDVAQIAV